MNDLLRLIEDSYLDRCTNQAYQKEIWKQVADVYPPSIEAIQDGGAELPPFIISRDAGDLGISVLWIVQAALVKTLINEVSPLQNDLSGIRSILKNIKSCDIGALAHSEDKHSPVVLKQAGGKIILNGIKKYITGGVNADFILLTAREAGEEKISRLVFIPRGIIPESSMIILNLKTLITTSHVSLNLHDLPVPGDNMIGLDPGTLRRIIKKWSMIERSLIIGAYIGLLCYFLRTLKGSVYLEDISYERVDRMLDGQKNIILNQIGSAKENSYIEEKSPDMKEILMISAEINGIVSSGSDVIPRKLKDRLSDLNMFSAMGG